MSAQRAPAISAAPLDLLVNEYIDYLLRNHDDSREGREAMAIKMEATGFAIGRRYAERVLREREERITEPLDALKWLCRELWVELFRKAVDRLQTNNRGVFVLQDTTFRWTKYISGEPGEDGKALTLKYMLIPCGLIRGALSAWGLDAVVNVDIALLPKAVFHVKLNGPAYAMAAAVPANAGQPAAGQPAAASTAPAAVAAAGGQ